jgi:predicted RNA methylase
VGEKGVDIYKLPDKCCETVFTNPPYNLMTPRKSNMDSHMLKQFLRISTDKVILLLNIFYLSSKDRYELLKNSHLKYVYIHSDRVTMYPYGQEKPSSTGTKMFAWFVWEHEYEGEPIIRWISK